MKMMYAGEQGSLTDSPDLYRFNCTINPACQKKFFIPIADLTTIDLYFDLPFMPSGVEISLIDFCSNLQIAAISNLYVAGANTRGFYAVLSNLSITVNLPDYFYIKVTFIGFDGVRSAVYYSNDFTTQGCYELTRVEGCYNNPTIGSDAYDVNGVYYGYPTTNDVLGNAGWRYYHSINVRYAKVIPTKDKITFGVFNYRKTYKASINKVYNFQSEVIPTFYKDEFIGVLSRGNITINGKGWLIGEDVELSVHSEESQLWPMDIPLNETVFSWFSCKETVCRSLPEVVPPANEVCCTPTLVNIFVETVAPPAPGACLSWSITALQPGAYVSYTDCGDGLQKTLTDINGTFEVCSTSEPDGIFISKVFNGNC